MPNFTRPMAVNIGAGQTGQAATLRASIVNSTGVFVSKDLSGFFEIGNGFYAFLASIPTGQVGFMVFHIGAVGSATDFSGVTVKQVDEIAPGGNIETPAGGFYNPATDTVDGTMTYQAALAFAAALASGKCVIDKENKTASYMAPDGTTVRVKFTFPSGVPGERTVQLTPP